MHQLLWRAAGLLACLLKNRRVGFFDTNILRKDHKREPAAQAASLRIAVAVGYESKCIPAGQRIRHRQNIRVELNVCKAMFEVNGIEVRSETVIIAAQRL